MQEKYFKQFTDDVTFSKLVHIRTTYEFMEHLKQFKEKIAIVDDEKKVNYKKLEEDALKIAYLLKENKVNLRENVGVFSLNDYDFVRASLGTMAYGSVATLLPYQLDARSLTGLSMKYNLKVVFYSQKLEEKVNEAKKNLPNVEFIEINDEVQTLGEFDKTMKKDDPACIVLTSGTTGKSKGAVLSHKALYTGVRNGTLGMKKPFDQVYVAVIPFTHVFGLIRSLLTALYTGSTVHTTPDMKKLFVNLKVAQPTILIVVPALAELFLKLAKDMGVGVLGGKLETVIAGGAHVSPYITLEFNKLIDFFGAGYGLTESANLVSGNASAPYKAASVGQFYPYQEYKIVNGELYIKGDNLMLGYYNDPEENAKAFDQEGYFKTGDLVRVDEEGFLYITGRTKEIIVLPNGENVSPAYIESKINEIALIQDSLVYEDKNEFGIVILVAELLPREQVLREKKIGNLEEYLNKKIEEVNQSLLPHERIGKVIVRKEDFPRTPSMKIVRPKREI
ncbi:MAG TPA: long-chain fatty acid--CoA ligase [Acholeplasmataceae bacterium]|nr:long-chain fatty acid--CoA ligase [Acholeplasmataceae bacterium]